MSGVADGTDAGPVRVGVSSCLLGHAVRHDGGHKRDGYILGTLADWFELVPVCPEVEAGLGVPRPPVRLVGDPASPRALGVHDATLDVTAALTDFAAHRVETLQGLCGYIFKQDSPSCGMQRVKVYPAGGGGAVRRGRGLFASAFVARWPLVPVEEEGRLGDPLGRENFMQRVLVLHRWQQLAARGLTAAGLVEFHARHQLVLMVHSRAACRRLAHLVASRAERSLAETAARYIAEAMAALRRRTGRGAHANVLLQLAGYLQRAIDGAERDELAETIDTYRRGEVSLVVPVTLLRHHFRRHPHPYVDGAYYLEPHPRER